MGSFSEHIAQSKSNLDFLSKINHTINDRWDWQVTVCFYSALHLMNAHIVEKTGRNYLSHNQVDLVINPFNSSDAQLDQEIYLSYNKLQKLSRRSRYLLSENYNKADDVQQACITYDKHFRKAIYHLDKIIEFTSRKYDVVFEKTELNCIELTGKTYTNFNVS